VTSNSIPMPARPQEVSLASDVFMVREAGKEAGFSQAVRLHQFQIGKGIPRAADQL